ncbi:hypothetical protein GCM10009665_79340 [Kitasatospora nipponensis]|uniref:Uncharacterized protein n=1 Tax=Kitasatospora nipponensis TaxID=258049 RepID=A0ABN1TBS8_9ACTN
MVSETADQVGAEPAIGRVGQFTQASAALLLRPGERIVQGLAQVCHGSPNPLNIDINHRRENITSIAKVEASGGPVLKFAPTRSRS